MSLKAKRRRRKGELTHFRLPPPSVPVLDGISALREIRSLEARGLLPGHQRELLKSRRLFSSIHSLTSLLSSSQHAYRSLETLVR